jgi:glycerol-3-phosphate acyltransferase PlsY
MEAKYIASSEAKRMVFGSIFFLNWVLFLVHLVLWISIVTIVEIQHKQRILGHTKSPNMYYDLSSHPQNH